MARQKSQVAVSASAGRRRVQRQGDPGNPVQGRARQIEPAVRESYRVDSTKGHTILTVFTNYTATLAVTLVSRTGDMTSTSKMNASEGMAWLEDCRQDRTLTITRLK